MSHEELTSQQIWYDCEKDKYYYLDEKRGSQDQSDFHGNVKRPFDPSLTGRLNYDQRSEKQKDLPPNFGKVELPSSLQPSFRKVYSPQNFLLEGYSQFPNPVVSPYLNQQVALQQDIIRKRKSTDAQNQLPTMRESIQSKWNKSYFTNILENTNFQNNNVGCSHLTSPQNYSKSAAIKNLMTIQKDFLISNIEDYQSKVKSNTSSNFNSPSKKKKPSLQEMRLEGLKNSFSTNIPGRSINGRYVKEPEYHLRTSERGSSEKKYNPLKDFKMNNNSPKSKEFQNQTGQSNFMQQSNMNQTTNATSKMQTTLDSPVLHNLFQNYKVDNDTKRRSQSTMDYETIRQDKIMTLTKTQRQSMDERQSGSQVGVIPNYKIKNIYLERIQPFFSQYRTSMNPESAEKELNQLSKIKDPLLSIRLVDKIEAPKNEFDEQEILGGQSKTNGAIMHKFKTDQAILDHLSFRQEIREKVKTKGRFQVSIPTSAGMFILDKDWQKKANLIARDAEKKRDDLDKKLLEKRRNQRLLKNQTMDQTHKIVVKKPTKPSEH